MAYRHVSERADYSDLASGFVLKSAPGHPAFPVRLAQELFLRATVHLPAGPVTLWDPCCGSGQLATVLGLLNRPRLARVVCSDVSVEAVGLARRNLALLTRAGLAARERELRERAAEFGKPGYLAAAEATRRLAATTDDDLPAEAVVADVFDPTALAAVPTADLVITDVPYGEQTAWAGAAPAGAADALPALVRSLCAVLPDHAVVVVCARARRISLGRPVRALDRLKVGHRAAFVGRVADLREV